MRKTLYILLLLLPVLYTQAQHNPFASINKPGKVVTLSNDKYVETHLNDSLQQIGSVIVNMNTGTIHQLLDLDSIDKTDKIDPTVATRWYSVDPLASKYPGMSPYNFVANNPIIYIDPDGKDIIIYGEAKDINLYVSQIKSRTKLDVEFDFQSSTLIVSGVAKNKQDKLLLEASQNSKISVNIYTTSSSFFKSRYDEDKKVALLGGAFEGSEIIEGKTITTQWVNPYHFKNIEDQHVRKAGFLALHELFESYIGGQDYPGYIPIPRKMQGNPSQEYTDSHYKADQYSYAGVEVNRNSDGSLYFQHQLWDSKGTTSIKLDLAQVTSRSELVQKSNDFKKVIDLVQKIDLTKLTK